MRIRRGYVGTAWRSAAALAALVPAAAIGRPGDAIPGSYICVFKPGPISAGLEARQSAAQVGASVTHVYTHAIHGFAATMSATAAEQIRKKNPLIEFCEQDREAGVPPNEASAAASRPGGGGGSTGQTIGWNITRVGGRADGQGKTAWVIDTGLDFSHPDLTTEPSRSKSFLLRDSNPADANGHGTHVGGIIGAKDNTIGVVGVAAGATLVSLRVLDRRGSGPDSGVIAAVDYLAGEVQAGRASTSDVANLSLETGVLESLDTAVRNLGATGLKVVIAAGNDAGNAAVHSPGRADGAGVYTVASMDQGDKWSFYSNYGEPPIDYIEPGSSIVSTVLNGAYGSKSGTSMAAPHLAGILLVTAPGNGGTVTRTGTSEAYTIGIISSSTP